MPSVGSMSPPTGEYNFNTNFEKKCYISKEKKKEQEIDAVCQMLSILLFLRRGDHK